jgi:hypothetical protein
MLSRSRLAALLAAATLLVACTAAALWLRENPYFFIVNALHSGMSSKDVREAVGEPCVDYGSMLLYRKSGAATLLLVLFDVGPPFGEPVRDMPDWFILEGPIQDGYTKYKVRKYRFFGPPSFGGEEGVLEFHWSIEDTGPHSTATSITPPELVALSTTIPKVDINGKPYPCFSWRPW